MAITPDPPIPPATPIMFTKEIIRKVKVRHTNKLIQWANAGYLANLTVAALCTEFLDKHSTWNGNTKGQQLQKVATLLKNTLHNDLGISAEEKEELHGALQKEAKRLRLGTEMARSRGELTEKQEQNWREWTEVAKVLETKHTLTRTEFKDLTVGLFACMLVEMPNVRSNVLTLVVGGGGRNDDSLFLDGYASHGTIIWNRQKYAKALQQVSSVPESLGDKIRLYRCYVIRKFGEVESGQNDYLFRNVYGRPICLTGEDLDETNSTSAEDAKEETDTNNQSRSLRVDLNKKLFGDRIGIMDMRRIQISARGLPANGCNKTMQELASSFHHDIAQHFLYIRNPSFGTFPIAQPPVAPVAPVATPVVPVATPVAPVAAPVAPEVPTVPTRSRKRAASTNKASATTKKAVTGALVKTTRARAKKSTKAVPAPSVPLESSEVASVLEHNSRDVLDAAPALAA
ncbi:hypothetical protein HKX48_000436 [Thoreauomyces humboldtii]|nr:hypothetical protein HKX48_000436 [Thoreauomyces humboldtii]